MELEISTGDIVRWTIPPLAERCVKMEVGAHLLAVYQHPAVLVSLLKTPVDRVEFWSGHFYVSVGLVVHGVQAEWVDTAMW